MSRTDATWLRVNQERRCPVCDHADWCLVASDGSAAICPRVADGAERLVGEAGWLHRLQIPDWRPPPRRVVVQPRMGREDLAALAERFRTELDPARFDREARNLGLTVANLNRLGVGWCAASSAWSYPMVDAVGRILGIRLRTSAGRKFAVRGGHEGLFVPDGLDGSKLLLIAEGLTDAAALLDLGFEAVGRPSCQGGAALLVELVRHHRPEHVAIVSDHDKPGQDGVRPGQDGARALAERLVTRCRQLSIVLPPAGVKDARAWVQAGGTREEVQAAIRSARVRRLAIRITAPIETVGRAYVR